jgi:hypothetical protein
VQQVTGSFTVKKGPLFYCLRFPSKGWVAAEMVQFIDDLLRASNPQTAIIKYLGFTTEISEKRPARTANHWIEVDLDKRILETNSEMIRTAVSGELELLEDEVEAFSARRIFEALDENNFTVRLFH